VSWRDPAVLFVGALAIVHGIFEIIGAIQLHKEIDNEWRRAVGTIRRHRPDWPRRAAHLG